MTDLKSTQTLAEIVKDGNVAVSGTWRHAKVAIRSVFVINAIA
jgi:hypothetical protein